jgi:hypothetical protein
MTKAITVVANDRVIIKADNPVGLGPEADFPENVLAKDDFFEEINSK